MIKGRITVADADPQRLTAKILFWKNAITEQGGTYRLGPHRWIPDPTDKREEPCLIEGVTIHIL